jgi:serine/threonine protein kinase
LCRMRRVRFSPSQLTVPEDQALFPDLTLGPIVGSGSFGVVRLGIVHSDGSVVAVKVVCLAGVEPARLAAVRCEVAVMQQLRHPNVPHLVKVVQTPRLLALVMEYCSGGSLSDYIKCRGCLSEEEARHYFKQLLSVVSYLHGLGWIHRDIKPDNILMMPPLEDQHRTQIKLCDFGLVTFLGRDNKFQTSFCGTPSYAAPEMILPHGCEGPNVDVWSMGVVLYVMLLGDVPFHRLGRWMRRGLSMLIFFFTASVLSSTRPSSFLNRSVPFVGIC